MTPPTLFSDYQQLLDALRDDAMIVVRRVARELEAAKVGTARLSPGDVTRIVAWITGIVCRTIAVSQHLAQTEPPPEEAAQRILPALESVLTRFAIAPVDHADYVRHVDAELVGERDAATDWDRFDGNFAAVEPESIRTIPLRAPALLLGELCRDLGMVMREVPQEWLVTLSPELRALCGRAATAAIRPHTPTANIGHLMER